MNPNAIQPWVTPNWLRIHLDRLYGSKGFGSEARAYIEACIGEGPSRKVQGRLGNVVIKFYSQKMDTSLLLESRTGEFPRAVLLERDPDVLAYFAQPPKVHVPVTNKDGKVETMQPYTPDFLVVRSGGIDIQETREDARLAERFLKNPHQFYRGEDGNWHYRAAESHFASLGFRYQLFANSSQPAILVENERFLEDYISEACPPVAEEDMAALTRFVGDTRLIPLRKLLDEGFQADHIFKAIADRQLYVDLSETRLAATEDVTVFADEPTQRAHRLVSRGVHEPALPIPGSMHLRTGSRLRWEGRVWTVHIVSERQIVAQDEQGLVQQIPTEALLMATDARIIEADGVKCAPDIRQLADCSPEELARAAERLQAVREGKSENFSGRSISRYTTRVAHAANDLDALLLLVDRQSERGNREAKISELNEEVVSMAIEAHYNTPEQSTRKGTYEHYLTLCQGRREPSGQLLVPISYATFCRRCNSQESITKRRGRRAAYQQAQIVQAITDTYPVHGVRPHEVCYVDHTIANLATISPSGMALGKPTLTIAVDGNTTHPRALILSYDPPSTRTVLMVLRDYVRRHRRLPRILVVDNGKEFHSRELEHFCKIYGIDLRYRSPGMPRGGSMIERLLGASEEEVLSEMAGNTRGLKKDARITTKSVDPYRRAEWTLYAAYKALDEYLFEIRPNRVHPALGLTPNEFEEQRLQETGAREHRFFKLDENLMLMTSPHAQRAHHKVDRQRGVWVDGVWYRHPALQEVRKGERVEVRVEPWSASIVYVQVKGRWVAAAGSSSRWLIGRTRREVEIALRAESRKSKTEAKKGLISERGRKHKEKLWSPEMFDVRLSVQQREAMHLYGELGMTTAMPLPEQLVPASVPSQAPSAIPPAEVTSPTAAQPNTSEPRPAPAPAAIEQLSQADEEQAASNQEQFSEGLRSQLGYR